MIKLFITKKKIIGAILILIGLILAIVNRDKIIIGTKLKLTYMVAKTKVKDSNLTTIRSFNYYNFDEDSNLEWVTEETERKIKHSDLWKEDYKYNVIYLDDIFNLNKHKIYGMYRNGYSIVLGETNINSTALSHEVTHDLINKSDLNLANNLSTKSLEEGYCDYIAYEGYNHKDFSGIESCKGYPGNIIIIGILKSHSIPDRKLLKMSNREINELLID